MKVIGTSIRIDQVEQLDQIATRHQVNRSIVIRWAIDAYLATLSLPNCPTNRPIVTNKSQADPLPSSP